MFLIAPSDDAYWSSYRLLEKQLIRISHSICFDDRQIEVYSSELADIINSACVKIESLAKDIYEEHILPFQLDQKILPKTLPKRCVFSEEKWTRKKWKYDYNCLVEIDEKYSICKKRINLKLERFRFLKYGSELLPFNNISVDNCRGGKWEYNGEDFDIKSKLIDVDWCKSYQEIKHNYIQSIPNHGTIKNAIMTMAAFYLLTIYYSCLPAKQFDWDNRVKQFEMDFGSELFSCPMWFHICPPFIYNSVRDKKRENISGREQSAQKSLLSDENGLPFLLILDMFSYENVKNMVDEYCKANNEEAFDLAPYEGGLESTSAGSILYRKLTRYLNAPFNTRNLCVAFNTGADDIYESTYIDTFEYEKSRYRNRTREVYASLKAGDIVTVKSYIGAEQRGAEVIKNDEHHIELRLENGIILSEAKGNILYIKKQSK